VTIGEAVSDGTKASLTVRESFLAASISEGGGRRLRGPKIRKKKGVVSLLEGGRIAGVGPGWRGGEIVTVQNQPEEAGEGEVTVPAVEIGRREKERLHGRKEAESRDTYRQGFGSEGDFVRVTNL